ncbi:MAG: hypothetical protein DWQ01_01640 [Planctomycetota bacterium]|nr:MAG: hypothetical protein DWQ01_01640 [Planctomycetota bacterium]
MKQLFILGGLAALAASGSFFALTVPNEIQQPGTQPGEVLPLDPAAACDACHGQYDPAVEPGHNWKGSMMAQAGRDPMFWAAMAIAEQDFDGAGDLCIRCHAPGGWLDDRSTPTDGSALLAKDADGVECDLCHRLVNPDNSEHTGVQNPPFEAHDGGQPPSGYYGSGEMVLWYGNDKLGPYQSAAAWHSYVPSNFHRESEICGTCHDVSNPLTGDLAPNNGAQVPLAPGTFSGVLGGPLADKAAFNNHPYAFGTVERTFSEHQASGWASAAISDYPNLPAWLQDGAVEDAYQAAMASTADGNYEDGTPRLFSCQSCHMKPVTGYGCSRPGSPLRTDLPLHDLTGGNYWTPQAIAWLDGQNRLRLGGGLSGADLAALRDGALRAVDNLQSAAKLSVKGNRLRVVNLTGHKLPTGYPEGRRMWLRIHWYGANRTLLMVDGEYGDLAVQLQGQNLTVRTLLEPDNPRTHVYHVVHGLSQEWAQELLTLGLPSNLALEYDRVSGQPTFDLGTLAAMPPGTIHESLHFALNNEVLADNRIPPYRMDYDQSRLRNILPVPADQYGNPGPGGHFRFFDVVELDPPAGAVRGDIELLYQPTSWEHIQFLYLANDGSLSFLKDVGRDLLDAWLNTGMAEPVVMATARWEMPKASPQ